MKELKNNLYTLLEGHEHKEKLTVLYTELLEFMIKKNWHGACHESCGVQYVLLNELGINCEWRLGEVFFKEKKKEERPFFFDHSWILIGNEIFDLALLKTNIPSIDLFPTIRNINLRTLSEPEVIYDTNSGWGDDINTKRVKNTHLSAYLNSSPMHPKLGTWLLIQQIGRKLGVDTSIVEMRKKYDGIYWK